MNPLCCPLSARGTGCRRGVDGEPDAVLDAVCLEIERGADSSRSECHGIQSDEVMIVLAGRVILYCVDHGQILLSARHQNRIRRAPHLLEIGRRINGRTDVERVRRSIDRADLKRVPLVNKKGSGARGMVADCEPVLLAVRWRWRKQASILREVRTSSGIIFAHHHPHLVFRIVLLRGRRVVQDALVTEEAQILQAHDVRRVRGKANKGA